jgi:HAD superfamily hydrolase (TIGR01509 family)
VSGTGEPQLPAAVLFDVDGTLMDTVYLHTVSWWEALRQRGHQVAMTRVHRCIGMGSDHLLDNLLGEDHDHDEDSALSVAQHTLYGQYLSRVAPLEGASDLLRSCAERGWRVVLASSASAQEAKVMTDALGADDAFFAITTADDVESSKPAPDLVQQALNRAGVSAGRAVFVGDAVWDAQAAHAAGVRFVGLLSGGGFSGPELEDAGAERVYESPADLLSGLDDSPLASLPTGGS